ncbi:ImmA/IrrE family metallo-endopeptidase [Patescibacteria group bacterium]|nr:ImmA/IrrE family metallo-endopeptidase [Patescibacteria group bacterium]MBU1679789.1 ImmA/IrrE family metallo-endopeptidase [Bacteroidota bacterium]MBU2579323.1 ImmA/IrrE family metallo-endopeptidase [Patescibacteria group bacterium]
MNRSDSSQFKAPKIPFRIIREHADDFRDKYWSEGTLPIDIFKIIELRLKLDVIPIRELQTRYDIDAFLSCDLKSIFVDSKQFEEDRFLNRIRFSVAHELGHLVLHSKIYQDFKFESIQDRITFILGLPEDEYSWIENQAHEFAGRLLVPRDILKECLDEMSDKIDFAKANYDDEELIASYIAPNICKKFQVSDQVIKKRILREKLL